MVPTVSSLTSTPSTAILAVRPNRPPKEIEEKPTLVGSKSDAVLHLNAGLELREIEEIASVDGQVFNLLFSENALHAGLLGIYGNRLRFHFDDSASGSDWQGDIRTGCFTHFHNDRLFDRLKTLRLGANRVVPRHNRARGVGAGGRCGELKRLVSVLISNGDLRGRNNRAAGIQNCALNAACGDRALTHRGV